MNNKANYTGLLTKRQQVECEPLMKASSSAKIKVKTDVGAGTEEWKEGDTGDALKTSITTSFGE